MLWGWPARSTASRPGRSPAGSGLGARPWPKPRLSRSARCTSRGFVNTRLGRERAKELEVEHRADHAPDVAGDEVAQDQSQEERGRRAICPQAAIAQQQRLDGPGDE